MKIFKHLLLTAAITFCFVTSASAQKDKPPPKPPPPIIPVGPKPTPDKPKDDRKKPFAEAFYLKEEN